MKLLTQERLKELLHYDPETGTFTNLTTRSPNSVKGQRAGSVKHKGYIRIKIEDKQYWAHRLAWLYVHGRFPIGHTDHIDGNGSNNSISNLRETSPSENNCNKITPSRNTSGARGVSWNKRKSKWHAYVKKEGKTTHLGYFESFEQAKEVAANARVNLHGSFSYESSRKISISA